MAARVGDAEIEATVSALQTVDDDAGMIGRLSETETSTARAFRNSKVYDQREILR